MRAKTTWKRFWNFLRRRAAGPDSGAISMRIAAGQALRLHDAAGWMIVCRDGSAWITQEADARDTFLQAGEEFALDCRGLTLVSACRDAVLAIQPPAGKASKPELRRAVADADQRSSTDDEQLTWPRALYPDYGRWNDPGSYRRSGLI